MKIEMRTKIKEEQPRDTLKNNQYISQMNLAYFLSIPSFTSFL